MHFVCVFSGLTLSLAIWAGLYAFASEADTPALAALAPYLEAFSITGWSLFVVLAAVFSWLTYRLLRRKRGDAA